MFKEIPQTNSKRINEELISILENKTYKKEKTCIEKIATRYRKVLRDLSK